MGQYEKIVPYISVERLSSYRKDQTESYETVLARYFWNVALCESLYPILQHLEVTLRNSIHLAATRQFSNDEFWFKLDVIKQEMKWTYDEAISKAEAELKKEGKALKACSVLSKLSFNFWIMLFNSEVEQVFLYKVIKEVFPNMKKAERTRVPIANKLNKILRLRNRVFHHEPIWNKADLMNVYQDMLYVIRSINPEMEIIVAKFDHFPEVYQRGQLYILEWKP